MTRARVPAAMTILALALVSTGSPAASGRTFQDPELPPELRKGLTDLESKYAVVSGSGHLQVLVYDDDNPIPRTSDRDFEFARKPGMYRRVETDVMMTSRAGVVKRVGSVVTCYDPKTAFRLHRPDGARAYEVIERIATTPRFASQAQGNMDRFHQCLFAIGPQNLDELIRDQRQVLNHKSRVDVDGKSMLKLEFGPSPALRESVKPGKRGFEFFFFTVVVAPDAGWSVQRFSAFMHKHADGQPTHVFTGTVEYKDLEGGVPVPSRYTLRTFLSKPQGEKYRLDDGGEFFGALRSVETWRFDKVRFDPEPDRAFTLPAFGIADADATKLP